MKTNFARTAMRITGVCGAVAIGAVCLASPAAANTAPTFHALAGTDVLALGPVERIDTQRLQIQVLGQVIVLPAAKSLGIANLLGHMVEVHGSVGTDGTLHATAVNDVASLSFVPGATSLYVKGVITEVDQASAVARLGSLSVKYSEALHTLSSTSLAVGQVAAFSGVEYSGVAAFYADNGRTFGSLANPLSQDGSDKVQPASQDGSDKIHAASQDGSDKVQPASQDGSDKIHAASQDGSDKVQPASQDGSDKIHAASQDGSDKVQPASQDGSDKIHAASQDGSDKVQPASQDGSDKIHAASQDGSDKVQPASQDGSDKIHAASQDGSD